MSIYFDRYKDLPVIRTSTQHVDDRILFETPIRVSLWLAISLYGGLDTEIFNFTFLHGQKRLLCLGRVNFHKDRSRIFILDEAISAVDYETDRSIVIVLNTEFASHTIISVIFRLPTV